jgi:hypothetical protein
MKKREMTERKPSHRGWLVLSLPSFLSTFNDSSYKAKGRKDKIYTLTIWTKIDFYEK